MGERDQTGKALLQENTALRRRVAELEHAEEERQRLLQDAQEASGRLFSASIRERDLADQERATLRALVDAMSDEVWLADAAGNIEFINRAAAERLGIEWEDALRVHISQLAASLEMRAEDGTPASPEQAPLLRSLKGKALTGIKQRVLHSRTGEWRHQQVSTSPVRDSQGRIVGAVAVARDTTEQEIAEQRLRGLNEKLAQRSMQLRALAEKLSRAEERERQRIARILHDHLQQLLVSARLTVDSLQHRLVDPPQRNLAQQANDVLDEAIRASRSLTAELIPPVLYDAGLTAALRWLARWMKERYSLRVDVVAEELDHTTPEATRILLFQAARELLFNVVKHAGVDRATIELQALPEGEVGLVVSDRGTGLVPALIEPAEGGGFGLFHLRERLDFLGGDMDVQSAPEQGTRVRVRVPGGHPGVEATAAAEEVAKGAPEREAVPAAQAGEQAVAGKPQVRVLLVDDHTIVRQGLARLLTGEADIQLVAQASDGLEAVELARATRPDVVLMDVSMPGMDGIEATRRITKDLPGVRVIGLSMHIGAEMADRMREAGAVDYVPKGGRPADLLEAVRRQSHPQQA